MAPPPNETQHQQESRIQAQQEAKCTTCYSLSPSSTLTLALPQAKVNMVYWRSIIQLNVAQSILAIPDIVSRAHAVSHSFSSRSSSSQSSSGHVSQAPRPNIRSGSLSPTHHRPSQTQDATGTTGSSGSSSYQQNPPFSLPVKSPEQIIRSSTKLDERLKQDNGRWGQSEELRNSRYDRLGRPASDHQEIDGGRKNEIRRVVVLLSTYLNTISQTYKIALKPYRAGTVTESGCTPSPLRLFVNAALLIERLLNLADVMQTSVFRGEKRTF
ncbi:hypothetical protein EDC04DRAFT_2610950 [Pisolithus marmoratus]|nr:hypothetical protein EDC04DRAFT_2610950 [Pisolithus marmoratus]